MQQRRNEMATKRSKRASETSAARSKRKVRARATPTERRAQPKGVINAWEDDPGAGAQPSGGQVIQRPVPVLRDQPFPIRIGHPASAPDAKPHPPGTAEFRYWTAAEALRRGADFWGALLSGTDKHRNEATLTIREQPRDAGTDLWRRAASATQAFDFVGEWPRTSPDGAIRALRQEQEG